MTAWPSVAIFLVHYSLAPLPSFVLFLSNILHIYYISINYTLLNTIAFSISFENRRGKYAFALSYKITQTSLLEPRPQLLSGVTCFPPEELPSARLVRWLCYEEVISFCGSAFHLHFWKMALLRVGFLVTPRLWACIVCAGKSLLVFFGVSCDTSVCSCFFQDVLLVLDFQHFY